MIELVGVIEDHPIALQADLLRVGLRLRWLWDPADDRVTWSDVLAVLHMSMLDAHSALMNAIHPDRFEWGLTEQLLAASVDEARATQWMFGGEEGSDPPPRIPRPGVEPPEDDSPNLLFNNAAVGGGADKSLDKDDIVDPREWLAAEDPRWQRI